MAIQQYTAKLWVNGKVVGTVNGVYAFMPPIGAKLTIEGTAFKVKNVEIAMVKAGGHVDVFLELA